MNEEYLEITEKELLAKWSSLFPDSTNLEIMDAEREFVNAFKTLSQEPVPGLTPLYFKTKAFKITIFKNLYNNFVNAALLASLEKSTGGHLDLSVYALFFANLFQLERIEIDGMDEVILIHLPLKKKYHSSKEWYKSLPKKLRLEISEIQFEILLNKYVKIGVAIKRDPGVDEYIILNKGNHIFKILKG